MFTPESPGVLYFHQYSPNKTLAKGVTVFSGCLIDQKSKNIFSLGQTGRWKKKKTQNKADPQAKKTALLLQNEIF